MKRWMFGVFAAVTLMAAGACGSDGGDNDDSRMGDSAAPAEGRSLAGAPAGGVVADGGGEGDAAQTNQADRKIIVNGTVALEAPDVAQAFSLAGRAARDAGGFVEESNLTTRQGEGGEERPYATITLRVPAESYDGVVEKLRGIEGVRVTSEGLSSQEVTEEYTDLQSRLRNLERTESQYLELLAKATTIEEILSVSDRLDGVRAQIEQTQGRMNLLDSLTAYARVDVSIAPFAAKAEGGKGSGPAAVFAEAWEWSVEVAAVFGVAAVYLLVIGAWLVMPAAVAGAAWAMVRRRRGGTPAAQASGGGGV